MKRTRIWSLVLAAGGVLMGPVGFAGTIEATADIMAKPVGPDFADTITLTNAGGPDGDGIATFWFAWVPGADFLPTDPLSVADPAGWKDVITHAGAGDGYAIQFDAISSTDDLTPGQSLQFGFTSADSPAALLGNSPFYTAFPVLTSFVYSQGPFRGDSERFLVSFESVPEPSSWVLGVSGILGALAWSRRRRRDRA